MATRTITIGCRDYDHTRPWRTDRVKVDGVDIKFINICRRRRSFCACFATKNSTLRRCHCRIT